MADPTTIAFGMSDVRSIPQNGVGTTETSRFCRWNLADVAVIIAAHRRVPLIIAGVDIRTAVAVRRRFA